MVSILVRIMTFLIPQTMMVSAMASSSSSSLKLRVCQGSGCLGKCRGAFNPLTSFEQLLIADNADEGSKSGKLIELEESFCMNQCKRGPNVRVISAENRKVLIFDDTIMNEMESNRKAFQRVANEGRVKYLWGVANDVIEGGLVATENGSVDKLRDIMPKE